MRGCGTAELVEFRRTGAAGIDHAKQIERLKLTPVLDETEKDEREAVLA